TGGMEAKPWSRLKWAVSARPPPSVGSVYGLLHQRFGDHVSGRKPDNVVGNDGPWPRTPALLVSAHESPTSARPIATRSFLVCGWRGADDHQAHGGTGRAHDSNGPSPGVGF